MDLHLATTRFSTLTDLDSSEILSSLWCYSLAHAQHVPVRQALGSLITAIRKRKAAVFTHTQVAEACNGAAGADSSIAREELCYPFT